MNYFIYCISGQRQIQKVWNKFFDLYLYKIRKIALSCKTRKQFEVFKDWIENDASTFLYDKLSNSHSGYFTSNWYLIDKLTIFLEDCIYLAKQQVSSRKK